MIKAWLVKTFFQDYLDSVLTAAARSGSIDAFKKAHADILETMNDDVEKRAEELAKQKLSDLLSPIDWNHVMTLNEKQGTLFIGGNRADQAQLLSLKAEAEQLASMELWKILVESPNALAQKTMFETGQDVDAFKKGRSMIYHLDTQKKIVETLKSYAQKN